MHVMKQMKAVKINMYKYVLDVAEVVFIWLKALYLQVNKSEDL